MTQKKARFVGKIGQKLMLAGAAALMGALPHSAAHGALSKGSQILINRGFQLEGLVTKDNGFHLSPAVNGGSLTGGYLDIGYNTVNWLYGSTNNPNSNVSALGPAPGIPWGRWVDQESNMPPLANEAPYMSNLVGLSLADEQDLNNQTIRDAAVQWFNDVTPKPAYANT